MDEADSEVLEALEKVIAALEGFNEETVKRLLRTVEVFYGLNE